MFICSNIAPDDQYREVRAKHVDKWEAFRCRINVVVYTNGTAVENEEERHGAIKRVVIDFLETYFSLLHAEGFYTVSCLANIRFLALHERHC